jgi:DUF438 domain-containing protein
VNELTMNQVIHGAVRRDLERTAAALKAFTDGDRETAAGLTRAWQNLTRELVHHHESEDALIWPYLRKVGIDDGLVSAMESEHRAMHEALEVASGAMAAFATGATKADARTAYDAVTHAQRVAVDHLTHEEQTLEPQMLRHTDTPEWRAVEKQLRAGSPVRAGWFFAWLLDGADPAHAAYLRSAVPAPVVLLLSRVLGIGYHRSIAPVWRP